VEERSWRKQKRLKETGLESRGQEAVVGDEIRKMGKRQLMRGPLLARAKDHYNLP